MNERIKELAIEATKYANTLMIDYLDLSDEDYNKKCNQEYNKKFAELIVRECSKVVVNGGYRNPALGEKHPITPPEIAQMIQEHFGVEE